MSPKANHCVNSIINKEPKKINRQETSKKNYSQNLQKNFLYPNYITPLRD